MHVKRKIPIKPGPHPQRGYGAEGSEVLSNLVKSDQDSASEFGDIRDVRAGILKLKLGQHVSNSFPL
jgi:hypothetical protein